MGQEGPDASLPQTAPEVDAAPGPDSALPADLAEQLQRLTVPSPIVTLDQDALFANSAYGQRVQAELSQDRDALTAENRRIEAELTAEEKDLTERRANLPPEEFSELARAFDEKVQQIRTQQDNKGRLLQQRLEEERQSFLSRAGPVLAELVRRRGAVAVIDRQALLLVFDEIDITDEAIELVDERIGTGQSDGLTGPPSSSFALPDEEEGAAE